MVKKSAILASPPFVLWRLAETRVMRTLWQTDGRYAGGHIALHLARLGQALRHFQIAVLPALALMAENLTGEATYSALRAAGAASRRARCWPRAASNRRGAPFLDVPSHQGVAGVGVDSPAPRSWHLRKADRDALVTAGAEEIAGSCRARRRRRSACVISQQN